MVLMAEEGVREESCPETLLLAKANLQGLHEDFNQLASKLTAKRLKASTIACVD
jgi:hypothetical protein